MAKKKKAGSTRITRSTRTRGKGLTAAEKRKAAAEAREVRWRVSKAVQMRLQGKTWAEIAALLNARAEVLERVKAGKLMGSPSRRKRS